MVAFLARADSCSGSEMALGPFGCLMRQTGTDRTRRWPESRARRRRRAVVLGTRGTRGGREATYRGVIIGGTWGDEVVNDQR